MSNILNFNFASRPQVQNTKATAPFKKLAKIQEDLFVPEHLKGFVFPDDPSHLKTFKANQFLQFIWKRQENEPNDVFAFQYWLDGKDKLQDQVETSDSKGNDDEELYLPGKRKSQAGAKSNPNFLIWKQSRSLEHALQCQFSYGQTTQLTPPW